MYIREMIFFTRGLSLLCRELPCERVEWIQSSYGSASGVQGFITRIFDSWFQSAFVREIAQARRTFHTRDSSSLHVSAVINPVLPPPPPLRACALVSLHLPITFIHSSDRSPRECKVPLLCISVIPRHTRCAHSRSTAVSLETCELYPL